MWTLRTFLHRLIWACMAPLLLLALASLTVNLVKAQAQRDADLEQRARLTEQYFDIKLSFHAQGLRMLAQSPHLAEPSVGPDFYREAQAFQANFGDHVVLAHEGRMLMNTRMPLGADLPPLPMPEGKSAVTQALESGRVAVGDLVDGPLSQSPLLVMAVPLKGPGRAGQTLLATMEAARFEQRIREISLPEGVRAVLLDSTGQRIAARGTIDLAAEPPAPFGRRIVLPLQQAPWSLVLEVDGAVQRALFMRDAALWLVALLAAAAAAYLAARLAGRRLEEGLRSLTLSSVELPSQRAIAELVRVRELLLRLNRERDQKEADLEESRAELRRLLTWVGQTQELERKRIALDIHDDLQQTLASIKLAAASLARADGDDQQAVRRELTQAINEQATQAVQSTRLIIEDLRPQALDNLGLQAALESLVDRFGREAGVEVTFEVSGAGAVGIDEVTVAPALAITLYRVAQEALNNVRKHAQARHLVVRLAQRADGQVELRIQDDGRGGVPASPQGPAAADERAAHARAGLGLAGMRERMRSVGGKLELRSVPDGGTEVVATAPNT